MQAKPLQDFVFVSKDDQLKQSASGLFLPGEERHISGTVLAVGPGRPSNDGASVVPVSVKVGDKVLFNKNTAVDVKVEGSDVFLLREEQLYCVL
jgi:chaperonin GroES